MQRIQYWFEIIAGIAHDEQCRLERAHAIFRNPSLDLDTLQTPACWRRRPRIRQI